LTAFGHFRIQPDVPFCLSIVSGASGLRSALRTTLAWCTRPQGRRWLLRGLLAVAIVGGIVWVRRPGDFAGYLTVGNLVLSGRHIYAEAPATNTWPPFFSLICVPLALLAAPAPEVARGFWILLNYAAVVLALHLIARLVYQRGLSFRAQSDALSLAAPEVLVPLLLTYRYVTGNFDHLQINIIIFTLALAGLYLQAKGNELAGSMALGAAAAIKVMPVVFIPYLAYRRQYRAAAFTTLAAAACSLSPILVFGWRRFWDYVAAWRVAVTAGWGVGKMNQSVFAMWDRFIGHGMRPFATAGIDFVPASGDARVIVATVASLGLVALLAVWIFRRPATPDGWAMLSEWSVVFIVSVLFGTVCWKAYLVVLLLPNAVLFAAWRSPHTLARKRRGIGGVLLAAFILGALPSPGFVGKALAGTLEMASLPTIATLVLLGGLFWFRARCEPGAKSARS
jgi:hypothetical protein